MSAYKHIYGIDVSMSTLDFRNLESGKELQIPNSTKGITDWIGGIEDKAATLCVFEATGCYSKRLAHHLDLQGVDFSIVSPNQSDGFAKAQGIVSKNDKQAAETLALMGKCLNLPLYQQPSEEMQGRKQLLSGINALKKQGRMLRNQLHALDNQIVFAPKVVEALSKALSAIEQQVVVLEEELGSLDDEEYQKQYDLITSVVGVGDKTARELLSACHGLHHFKSAKQLAKFVGLVPGSHFSGTSVRKRGKMTKKGSASLRSTLFMAARSAKRYNMACKELYQRMRIAGKPYKQAVVAVMHKLVKQIFGVVNSGISFDNQFYLKFKK